MTAKVSETAKHCSYCGRQIADAAAAPERFGERFCSEGHADEFVAGVRAARMRAAAQSEMPAAPSGATGSDGCALPPPGQRGWRDYLKRGACWGAPLLLLAALPLIWSGGWVAAGGSLLSVAALLACPLGMYFTMRGMMSMQHQHGPTETERGKEDHSA